MKRDQLLLGGVLSFILVVFLVAFFLPQSNSIAQMKRQLHQARQGMLQSRSLSATLGDQQRRHARFQDALADIDRQLPAGEAVDRFLLRVAQLLAEEQLQAGTIEPKPPVAGDRLLEIPMQLSCSGEFGRLYRFATRLESLPRVTRVNELSIAAPRDEGGVVQMTMQLSVFSLGAGQSASASSANGRQSR